jgi:26S proteasome regulatory subunit N2
MPQMDFVSHTRPSLFDYPPMTEIKTKQAPTKVATAILSTTAKTQARKKTEKKDGEADDKMEVVKENEEKTPEEKKEGETASDGDKKAETAVDGDKKEKEKDKKEPNTTLLNNPARVLIGQKKHVAMPAGSRCVFWLCVHACVCLDIEEN